MEYRREIDRATSADNASAVAKHSKALGPEIGQRITRLMRAQGLTDRELGDKALVAHTTIQKLRQGFGGNAGAGTLANVARALGVRPAWLIFNDGPQSEPESPSDAVLAEIDGLSTANRKAMLKKLRERYGE